MKTQITLAELQAHLDEQIQMLKNSAASFDNGSKPEYKRLATTIRVLLHDTKNSTSLLAQLNKKTINFFDTAIPYNDAVYPHLGLINVTADVNGSQSIAPLDDGMKVLKRYVSFENWWNGIVFSDKQGNEFSRKDIVLFTANQDGGAHIDPEVQSELLDLKKLDAQFGG